MASKSPLSALLAAAALSLLPLPAGAQSYTVLHAFETPAANPSVSLQGADGNFYGTTFRGGPGNSGTVLRFSPTGTLTTLYSFSGNDGDGPIGLVWGVDGNFYGTTYQGGAKNSGTVFRMTPTGTLTTLASFKGSDGAYPKAGLVQGSDGNFYGTTYQGGADDLGTVFRITPAGTLTTLHSFMAGDGSHPAAPLVEGIDGNFYGATLDGGAGGTPYSPSGFGTIFKITPAGAFTTLYSFVSFNGGGSPSSGVGGQLPYAGLTQGTDGNLYGTASSGGAGREGTVFKITPSGALTTLYSFSGMDGASPDAGLVQGRDGSFYGTTGRGGPTDNGTLFSITPTGTLTTLHSFTGNDGSSPRAPLVQGTDGNFYGTTSSGGAGWNVSSSSGLGTIFRLAPGGVLTTLYSFTGTDGQTPMAGLLEATDGSFYGTTYGEGVYAHAPGTVFRITPAGVLTTFCFFAGAEGSPLAGLVQGTDGNFYGTTSSSRWRSLGTALPPYGSVFRITPGGDLTTLYSFFEYENENPYAGLVQGTDGNFYGTTILGGEIRLGMVFRISSTGMLTRLYSFSGSESRAPWAPLVQGTDGNFYGTTSGDWGFGNGTVFRVTPTGTLTTLWTFSGKDGQRPLAALVQGIDGSFYGTTHQGGSGGTLSSPRGFGTVFKITPAGALTTLHSFTGSDGSYPYAGLVQGRDGSFYGTTGLGGASDKGTIFSITPTGTLTTLHSFTGADGSSPRGPLVQGSDGFFYGTAAEGGALSGGVVFRLTPGPGPEPTVTAVSPSSGTTAGEMTVTISGTEFQPGAAVSFGDVPASVVAFIDARTIRALTPAHAAGTVTVTVTNPDGRKGGRPSAYTFADPRRAEPPSGPNPPHPIPPGEPAR